MVSTQNDPPDREEEIDWIRLHLITGLGPRLRSNLLERFPCPRAVLEASQDQLQSVPGVGPQLASAIHHSRNRLEAENLIRDCRANGIQILSLPESHYPRSLREIPDPPGLLFVQGQMTPADELAIAIVGTRHASRYGIAQTRRLATGLSQAGYTIISGLARGIDTAAHQAVLESGGRTIAVLGSGLHNVYPPENQELAREISQRGAVLSEYGLHHQPKSSSFPQRNRIVTGLSLGVVVVEAADRSGALISAGLALEQNREVFALPGRVDCRTSRGCHRLIREGAKLVERIDHVLEELGPLAQKTIDQQGRSVSHPAELLLNVQEKKDLDAIDDEYVSIDTLVARTQLPVSRVLSTLSVLETKRLLTRIGGARVSRL